MTRDDNTRFRITPWPEAILPLPPREGGIRAIFDPDAEAFFGDFDAGLQPVPPRKGETYLRLATLNPEDPWVIADFLTDFGELGVRGQFDGSRPWDCFAMATEDEAVELIAAWERAAEAGHIASDTLLEAQWAILMMRDMIAAWRVEQDELDPTVHTWECPLWAYRNGPLDGVPWSSEGPASLLHLTLGSGLTPFGPTIRMFPEGQKPVPLFAGEASSWNRCCLELFNHIVERATYKTCANETCGRLFVRQEGRAEHGQHRTSGVKYCSSWCARAQAQRTYRRRLRADGAT